MAGKVSQQCSAAILVHVRNFTYLELADHNCKVHGMKGEGGCADIGTLDGMVAKSNRKVYEECS